MFDYLLRMLVSRIECLGDSLREIILHLAEGPMVRVGKVMLKVQKQAETFRHEVCDSL